VEDTARKYLPNSSPIRPKKKNYGLVYSNALCVFLFIYIGISANSDGIIVNAARCTDAQQFQPSWTKEAYSSGEDVLKHNITNTFTWAHNESSRR
jgi:hypothetical protein